jgi:two-component system sensor histidine kinase BaeS
MRSISVKITLVLVVISLIGALFTSFYIQNRTQKAFDSFIRDQDQQVLVEALSDHYLVNGNWENAQAVFQKVYPFIMHNNPGENVGGNPPGANSPFILTSPTGEIQDTSPGPGSPKSGSSIPLTEVGKGIPIEVNEEIVGWLVPAPSQRPRNNTQQNFLGTVQDGLIISSIVTLLIALILGGFLIQSFTHPIRKLAGATEKVAGGDLGFQVDIDSKDELGKLASSFNRMSSDLEKADLSRKQMTSDIAHDLRTPLTIMQGYTEAMSEGKMAGSQEIYQVMHQQAKHLNYLIDDLKTLSLLDSEELAFQNQNIDPANILQQVESAFSPLADEKGIQLSLTKDQILPRMNLDPGRLTQILGNLINNALQVLSSGGKIEVSAIQEGDNLLMKVADNGPGISDENLPLIFNRSFRADKSRTSENGSSGLGLAITKKLVEAQGGSISVESKVGTGTTFLINFPIV